MMRSLFAAISGLVNQQVKMDVIGNNVANVNTTGYKSSRVLFQDILSQTLRSGQAPSGDQGTINPSQVGLGVTIAGIESNFAQGSLETTGKVTDLAIQGDGFFILSNGEGVRYSRAGAFDIGSDGDITNLTTGYKVQGWQADALGAINTTDSLGSIHVPIGSTLEASATSQITMGNNLNGGGAVGTLGAILSSQRFLATAEGADDVSGLRDESGNALSLADGSVIEVSPDGGTTVSTLTKGTDFDSLAELAAEIQAILRTVSTTATVSVTSSGALEISNPSGGGAAALTVTLASQGGLLPGFDSAMDSLNGAVLVDDTSTSGALLASATGTDLLVDLYDYQGNSLGLSGSDMVAVSGKLGGIAVADGELAVGGATLADLLSELEETFGITNVDGAQLSDGMVELNCDVGAGYAVSDLGIDTLAGSPSLVSATRFSTSQEADGTTYKTSVDVFDSLGVAHSVGLIFNKTGVNEWDWQARVDGVNVQAGTNTITFDENGRFDWQGGATIEFDPDNGAAPLSITLDLSNLSQGSGTSTASVTGQDGYAQGELASVSIGANGVVSGTYTNGRSRVMGQVAMATFTNPSGLLRAGNNMFEATAQASTTGSGMVGVANSGGRGAITSGALEMSNVDIAKEFVDLIITQRGFQTNARVITTSDELLKELVDLKR